MTGVGPVSVGRFFNDSFGLQELRKTLRLLEIKQNIILERILMKKRLFLMLPVLVLAAIFRVSDAQAAQPQVSLETFSHANGESYFEMGLKAPLLPSGNNVQNEVVFLFDTSASQVGPVRKDQYAALKGAIARLPKGTKAQLIAVDVRPEAYTTKFLDAQSPEFRAAVQEMQDKRVPLGSTDLDKGIAAVVETVENDGNAQARRTVIYLGDGLNSAKGIPAGKFQKIVDRLVDAKVSFSGCPIGVRSNFGLIGALANQSGGFLVNPGEVAETFPAKTASTEIAAQVGSVLGQSVEATVFWPEPDSVQLPESWDVFPSTVPPLRSDRETILLGKTSGKLVDSKLELTASTTQGQSKEFLWNLRPSPSRSENQYLVSMLDAASKDKGLGLPTAGRNMLEVLKDRQIEQQSIELGIAHEALKTGQAQAAARIAEQVKSRTNGDNPAANDLLDQAASKVAAENARSSGANRPRTTVDDYVQSNSIRVQSLNNTVSVAIAESEKLMTDYPDVALQNLKLIKAEIQQETELPPDVRNKMIDRLENKMKTAYRQLQIAELRKIEEDAVEAERINQALMLSTTVRNEEKARQLMARFSALVTEKLFAQSVIAADTAKPLIPYDTSPHTASIYVQAAGVISEINDLRILRERGMIDVLMTAERVFVPLCDEPPILWPDPEVWNALSERRKELYQTVDLSSVGDAEKKITKALDSTASIDSNEIGDTLQQLLDYLQDKFKIVALFDTTAMAETEATPDSKWSGTFTGIKVRSAMKHILKEHELTYCIQDECLMITTQEEVEKHMSIKVYPMGDLVVSPAPQGGMGGMSGGMGGMGGMSGGMGGMSGGMGGMGGMSGGMGGMGGGMYNLPSKYEKILRYNMVNSGMIQANPNSFFAVVDKVASNAKKKQSANSSEAISSPEPPAEKPLPEKLRKIDLKMVDADNPDTYWNKLYSAPLEERPDDQETARAVYLLFYKAVRGDLAKARQIVSLIQCAIRNGEVQPWMYESLAVALHLLGAPQAELERAILSAQDFCESPLDALYLAVYLQQFGSKQCALDIYTDVISVFPMRPEPYIQALRLAEELNDEEAIRTLTLASAGQVWDGKWAKTVGQAGRDMAESLLEKMQKDGREEEAKSFREALAEARRRDCEILVEYTGDGELDIIVKEPVDTYCWYDNPRTVAGGVLLKSPWQRTNETDSPDVKRAVYVCPRAFNGNYEVLVQRAMGKIANNKFKMTVLEDGLKKSERFFELGEDGAIVKFDLEKGRLDDTLKEAEIEAALLADTVVENRIAVTRQIASLSNQSVAKLLNDSSSTTKIKGATTEGENANPLVSDGVLTDWIHTRKLREAVGYSPSITLLPTGAGLSGTAIVSSDRRYVRLSPQPFFSQIRRVVTYNLGTGETTDTTSQTLGN